MNAQHRIFIALVAAGSILAAGFAVPGRVAARSHPTPTPTASPTPPPPEDPAIHKIAIRELVAWQAGVIDRTRYSAAFNKKISDAAVTGVSALLGKKGAFQSAQYLGPVDVYGAPAGTTSYLYHMACANDSVYERLTLQPTGVIEGILFEDKLPTDDDD